MAALAGLLYRAPSLGVGAGCHEARGSEHKEKYAKPS
jgi:hypothetical protein